MIITFFALSRLGFTVMMLSTRLSAVACDFLLNAASCDTVLYGQSRSVRTIMGELLRLRPVACRPIVQRSSLDEAEKSSSVFVFNHAQRPENQIDKPGIILHSSGSTGLPKPLFVSQGSIAKSFTRGNELSTFNPLPWFHAHGLNSAMQAMYKRKTAFMWNTSLPLTTSGLVKALEAAQPEFFTTVPYALQLLVDDPRGISALRKCKSVSYGGAPCPDELGDRLQSERIRFGGAFGL